MSGVFFPLQCSNTVRPSKVCWIGFRIYISPLNHVLLGRNPYPLVQTNLPKTPQVPSFLGCVFQWRWSTFLHDPRRSFCCCRLIQPLSVTFCLIFSLKNAEPKYPPLGSIPLFIRLIRTILLPLQTFASCFTDLPSFCDSVKISFWLLVFLIPTNFFQEGSPRHRPPRLSKNWRSPPFVHHILNDSASKIPSERLKFLGTDTSLICKHFLPNHDLLLSASGTDNGPSMREDPREASCYGDLSDGMSPCFSSYCPFHPFMEALLAGTVMFWTPLPPSHRTIFKCSSTSGFTHRVP